MIIVEKIRKQKEIDLFINLENQFITTILVAADLQLIFSLNYHSGCKMNLISYEEMSK